MLVAVMLALGGFPSQNTVELFRGAKLPDSTTSYWSVSDTTLDASSPDEAYGGDPVLSGGPTRTTLLRFGDLERVVPPSKRVKRASIVLVRTAGPAPELRLAGRVRSSWHEGPARTLNAVMNRPRPVGNAPAVKEPAPRGAATWRLRRSGEPTSSWQQPGGLGPSDLIRIEKVQSSVNDDALIISGLGEAVQEMVDRPWQNWGFAFGFSNAVEFASTQSTFGRPKLVLELEDRETPSGPDLSVIRIERSAVSGRLPTDGEEATYSATIRNVGTAASGEFSLVWTLGDREGTPQPIQKKLLPGEETVVQVTRTFRPEKMEPRFQSVLAVIDPKGPDASSRNNGLSVYESGRPLEVVLTKQVADSLASRTNMLGSKSLEDWVQHQVRVFNEVILPQSRFSFAPDGARDRVSVQKVSVGSGVSADLIRVEVPEANEGDVSRSFLRALAVAIGAPDLSGANVVASENKVVDRGSVDRWPGLLGYGDTRYEGSLLGRVPVPIEPVFSPLFEVNPLEATDLLSGTDVATLNARIDGLAPNVLPPFPRSLILRSANLAGEPMKNVEMTFYPVTNGRVSETPSVTVKTDDSSTALIPDPFQNATAYLVKGVANGITEWTWLKRWQAIDLASRGSSAAAVMDLRFSLPGAALEVGSDLARDRVASDSSGSLPAKLVAVTDGSPATTMALGAKNGDWIEIDLGRDRTVAEISILASKDGLARFDILTYSTGQNPAEALPWAREVDWEWTSSNRRDLVEGVPSVAYRGQPRRFRFVRIVNKSGKAGQIADVRVVPAVVQ